ncbi:SEC-C metal-binding domain-containing protein [Fredinandcohnia humi]
MVVGRNELCTCGSGKKYKKCCGKNVVLSIEQVIEVELHEIQNEIFKYAVDMYTDVIDEYLEQYSDTFEDLPEEAYDLFDFFARVWVVTSVEMDGKTILEEYIDRYSHRYSRQRIKDILQTWKSARPSAYIVKSVDDMYSTVQDIFTKKEQRVRVFETETELDEGYFILGTLLPAGANGVFFTTFLELPKELAEGIAKAILELYEYSDEQNPVDFMSHQFLEVFSTFMFGKPGGSAEDFFWNTPKQKEVAELYQQWMLEYGYDESIVEMGNTLWYVYCERINPMIKKPGVYVAALIYLVESIYPYGGISGLDELADEFDISETSISKKSKEFEKVLEVEIEEYNKLVRELEVEFDHHF